MGDLCSSWDAINNMFVLQHTMIKASFQKSINVVEHKFNTLMYKKLHNFVSREARDLIFYELQRVATMDIDSPCQQSPTSFPLDLSMEITLCNYIISTKHTIYLCKLILIFFANFIFCMYDNEASFLKDRCPLPLVVPQ